MNTTTVQHYLNLCLGVYLGALVTVVVVASVARTGVVLSRQAPPQRSAATARESVFAATICAEDIARVEEIKAWKGANARDAPKQTITDILYRAISRPVQVCRNYSMWGSFIKFSMYRQGRLCSHGITFADIKVPFTNWVQSSYSNGLPAVGTFNKCSTNLLHRLAAPA